MEKRRQAIVDVTNQLGEISIHELKNMFPNVSEVTLRKDLQFLDVQSKLVRVHGGARSINDVTVITDGRDYNTRSQSNQAEKAIIGQKAAELLRSGMSVFISPGSTCVELVKQLPQKPLQIFTDGISVALNARTTPDISVELIGGLVDRSLMRLVGPSVYTTLDTLHFDYAFIGTMGLNETRGFAVGNPSISASTFKLIEHSQKNVILMDSSKVNQICTPRNIPFSAIDILISDGKLPSHIVELLQSHGITVL